MRKLKFSENEKEHLMNEFKKEIENYEKNITNKKLSFTKEVGETVEEKIKVIFTPTAYLKSILLVRDLPGEVGWQGTIGKLDDKSYIVEDVFVYPQVVNGARTRDMTQTNEWYEDMANKGLLHRLRFQAHSHVNMGTHASDVDLKNQKQVVMNIQKGFYLFQIWNKQGSIDSYLYDLENGVMYDSEDIDVDIAFEDGKSLEDFCKSYCKFIDTSDYEKVRASLPNYSVTHYDSDYWKKMIMEEI